MQITPDWSNVETKFQQTVKDAVKTTKQEAASRAIRASNELRNAALYILRGQRSGRVYRKPYTKSATYTASAPGEPPAVRSGALRQSWGIRATGDQNGNIMAGINTEVKYASILQDGSPKMAARPYKEAIIKKTKPAVMAIYQKPFLTK